MIASRHLYIVSAVALSLAWFAPCSEATVVSFTVDPASTLDLEMIVAGFVLDPQGPGSLTTAYSGTISVDVDDIGAPASIDFLTSAVVAANSGSWLPAAGGGPAAGDPGVAAPANYGVFEATSFLLIGDAYGAIRDIQIDITTPGGALPVTGGTAFAATQTLAIAAGVADVNYNGGLADPLGDASRSDLAGTSDVNAAATDGSYARVGSLVTLTIPIDVELPVTLEFGAGTANISGALTATADISTGDFDQDGDQDGRDYLSWQRGFGTLAGASLSDGDGNYDGAVLGDDLEIWKRALGAGSSLGASFRTIPEPRALPFLAVGLWWMGIAWRARGGELRDLP